MFGSPLWLREQVLDMKVRLRRECPDLSNTCPLIGFPSTIHPVSAFTLAFSCPTIVPSCFSPSPHTVSATSGAKASLLGCAFFTAMGAIRNAAELRAGQSTVIIGAGGVGCLGRGRGRPGVAGNGRGNFPFFGFLWTILNPALAY